MSTDEAATRSFSTFLLRLERRLAQPLPGLPAQLAMAPRPRRRPQPPIDPERPLPAAVLALLFPAERGDARLVLTRRTDRVRTHKGEVCLPGGALDPGESALEAALREADEEIGVERAGLRVLGRLTPLFIPVSGFRIEPFVAAASVRPSFRVAAHEVEELIELPLRDLLDPTRRGERRALRAGHEVVIPYFEIAGKHVWGATAMILAELAALFADVEPAS